MTQVNIYEAKTNLSKLIRQLQDHEEDVIVIANNGTPVVQITRTPKTRERKSPFGAARDLWDLPEDFDEIFDALDSEIGPLFETV